MNNKNNVIKFGLLGLSIVLIIVGFVLFISSDDSDNNSIPENNKTNSKKYTCENKIEDISYTSYQIETVVVENGIVKKTIPTMKVVCKNKDVYNIFKNDKEYNKDKSFDDQRLTITFANGSEILFDKDVNGLDVEMKFSDYESRLKEAGYVCSE